MWKKYVFIWGGILLFIGVIIGAVVIFNSGDNLFEVDNDDWVEDFPGDEFEEEMIFNDVSESHDFSEYILYVTEREIMSPDNDGNFYPDGLVLVSEFLESLARASMPRMNFDDFSGEDFLDYFIELDVLNEDDAKKYSLDSKITKSQVAVLLAKVDMGIRNTEQVLKRFYFNDLKEFSDKDQTLINHSVGRGFLSGNGNNFNPNQLLSRANLAKVIYLFINR